MILLGRIAPSGVGIMRPRAGTEVLERLGKDLGVGVEDEDDTLKKLSAGGSVRRRG